MCDALAFLLDPPPSPADVQFAYAGWRALPRGDGPPGALHREAFLVEEQLPQAAHAHRRGRQADDAPRAGRAHHRAACLISASSRRRANLPLPGGDGPREVDDPLWWRHGSLVGRVRELMRERPAFANPICPHRPFLVAELVHALREEGAVTFADVMLRRLVDPRGPCLEPACLRAAFRWFDEYRTWPGETDVDKACAALRAEVAEMTGDLDTWRAAAQAPSATPPEGAAP